MTSDKYRSLLSILHNKKALNMYGPDSIHISNTFINHFNKQKIFSYEHQQNTLSDFRGPPQRWKLRFSVNFKHALKCFNIMSICCSRRQASYSPTTFENALSLRLENPIFNHK